MKSITILKRLLLAIAVVAFISLFALSSHYILVASNKPSITKLTSTHLALVGSTTALDTIVQPVHIKIPKINVNAPIDLMGIDPDGLLESPGNPRNAGWYKFGPRPGDIGNAVIDGHYGQWASGEKSVFDDLNKLQKGDLINIEDSRGVATVFVVRELKMYDPKDDSASVFTSKDGLSHLNLITCDGAWNETTKSYPKRLVVFTDKQQ